MQWNFINVLGVVISTIAVGALAVACWVMWCRKRREQRSLSTTTASRTFPQHDRLFSHPPVTSTTESPRLEVSKLSQDEFHRGGSVNIDGGVVLDSSTRSSTDESMPGGVSSDDGLEKSHVNASTLQQRRSTAAQRLIRMYKTQKYYRRLHGFLEPNATPVSSHASGRLHQDDVFGTSLNQGLRLHAIMDPLPPSSGVTRRSSLKIHASATVSKRRKKHRRKAKLRQVTQS
jgi:hypothetical protein